MEDKERRTYAETAKELGIHFRVWKYGIQLFSYIPDGSRKFHPRLIPLNGWILDGDEVIRHFRENGFEL